MDRINSLEQKSQEDRVASYLKQLDTGINGDWRKLNVDPNFHAWLSETDPMTMSVRGNLLNAAAENFRVDQVVSIFNQYLSGSNVTAQSTVTIADELPGGGWGDRQTRDLRDGSDSQQIRPLIKGNDLVRHVAKINLKYWCHATSPFIVHTKLAHLVLLSLWHVFSNLPHGYFLILCTYPPIKRCTDPFPFYVHHKTQP